MAAGGNKPTSPGQGQGSGRQAKYTREEHHYFETPLTIAPPAAVVQTVLERFTRIDAALAAMDRKLDAILQAVVKDPAELAKIIAKLDEATAGLQSAVDEQGVTRPSR